MSRSIAALGGQPTKTGCPQRPIPRCIVEVSESTYLKDRTVKLARYAKAAIPIYWIVHLARRRVEVYSQPAGRRYLKREDYEESAQIPVVLDGVVQGSIAVSDILPKRKGGGT